MTSAMDTIGHSPQAIDRYLTSRMSDKRNKANQIIDSQRGSITAFDNGLYSRNYLLIILEDDTMKTIALLALLALGTFSILTANTSLMDLFFVIFGGK